MDDIIVVVVLGAVALLFLWLGYLIWIKEKINLIHAYHYTKVKEADKKVYTSIMGKAMIVIGIGMVLSDILFLIMRTGECMIVFVILYVVGLGMMTYAQIKYNRGIF